MSLRNRSTDMKKDNRGAAIAMTIVAISVISVLALLALWIAYMNYYMKVTDRESTDNFYSAEGVVEQMRVGLQNELSNATGDAYRTVMQKYASKSEADRKSIFLSTVESSLKDSLKDAADATETSYDMLKLCEYVWNPEYDAAAYSHLSATTGGYEMNLGSDKVIMTTTSGRMELLVDEGTVFLRDINVEYQNDKGYTSVINTDFKLQVPTVNFGDTVAVPDLALLRYILIADQHLVSTSAGAVQMKGSVYGGNGDADPASTSDDKNNCIIIDDGAKWTFNNSDSATSEGYTDVVISGKAVKMRLGSGMTTTGDTELWTSDFSLGGKAIADGNGQELTLGTKSYVADDLSIDGRNCKVKLSDSYYGYGIGITSDDNDAMSAILINGQQTSLDLSGLNELWLGGRSYVGTRKIEIPAGLSVTPNVNIPMSDSIAVRGNQVAYLVPGEALPGGKNPMTKTEYENNVLANEGHEGFVECNLADTLVPGAQNDFITNYATEYKKIFAPGLGGEYLVYYYMVMDSLDAANAYFEAFYGIESNKNKLDKYLLKYLKTDMGMKADDSTDWVRLDLNGNWLSLDGDPGDPPGSAVAGTDYTINLHRAADLPNSNVEGREGELTTESIKYGDIFEKLVNNISKTTRGSSERVFDNIIKRDEVEDFCGASGTYEFTVADGTYAGKKGIVTTADSYTHPGGDVVMVISTGDVNITSATTKGTVICAGTIKVKGSTTIETDDVTKEAIMKVLQASKTTGLKTRYMYEFLQNGDAFVSTGDDGEEMTTITDMNELVNYENWSKR